MIASENRRIPRLQMSLVSVQLVLALLATALDLVQACGACAKDGTLHLGVAAAGVLGYGALLTLGLRRQVSFFYLGIYAASGVHAVLGAVLIADAIACVPCILSAAVALVLCTLAVRAPNEFARHCLPMAGSFAIPTLVLFLLLARGKPQDTQVPLREGRDERSVRLAELGEASLDVYEATHCSYCRSFREDYLPLLEADFKGRLAVRFHDAAAAGWVQRTPTFVLNGKLLFEGLPYRYQDLSGAVDAGIPRRNF